MPPRLWFAFCLSHIQYHGGESSPKEHTHTHTHTHTHSLEPLFFDSVRVHTCSSATASSLARIAVPGRSQWLVPLCIFLNRDRLLTLIVPSRRRRGRCRCVRQGACLTIPPPLAASVYTLLCVHSAAAGSALRRGRVLIGDEDVAVRSERRPQAVRSEEVGC